MLKWADIKDKQVKRNTPVLSDLPEFVNRLKPGDIIVTKPSDRSSGDAGGIFAPIISAVTGSPWVHTSVYVGGGKVTHLYSGVTDKSRGSLKDMRVRTQSLKSVSRLGNDFLALRPKVDEKAKQEAVKRINSLKGTPVDVIGFLRAGFLPGKRNKELKRPDEVICTGATAFAYPDIDWRKGKSSLYTRAVDFVKNRKVKEIAAYDPVKTASRILQRCNFWGVEDAV